jgi:hypothetical protein
VVPVFYSLIAAEHRPVPVTDEEEHGVPALAGA